MIGATIGRLLLFLTLIFVSISSQADGGDGSTIRLSPSDFRLIKSITFEGDNLDNLAVEVGMTERGNTRYRPSTAHQLQGGGRHWYGSTGIGLIAHVPEKHLYSIYYFQETALSHHHLRVAYADDDYVFFWYEQDIRFHHPAALEVYSIKRDRFARIRAISTQNGKFGAADPAILEKKRPGSIRPSVQWNYRHLADLKWVSLEKIYPLCFPGEMTQEEGIFTLSYNTDWKIDEFTTRLKFSKEDLEPEWERLEK